MLALQTHTAHLPHNYGTIHSSRQKRSTHTKEGRAALQHHVREGGEGELGKRHAQSSQMCRSGIQKILFSVLEGKQDYCSIYLKIKQIYRHISYSGTTRETTSV